MRFALTLACGLLLAGLSLHAQVSIATQPAAQAVAPGTIVTFTVGATGTGTLSYQWRKGGTAINTTTYPSASTATLNLGAVATGDAGTYDVLVTDSTGATTPSLAVTLSVGATPATVTLGALNVTYNGTAQAATATTVPSGLTVAFTYNGSTTAPTNAGTYAVVGTVTTSGYAGSATGNLTIAKASPTISFTTPAGYAPAVGVPFAIAATASSGLTPVTFSIAGGNATATGTNGATITCADTSAVTIQAVQLGDANNNNVVASLTVTAASPVLLSSVSVGGTYAQTFDSLASGLPAGWRVLTGATASALGADLTPATSFATGVSWATTTGNFRNVASALNGGVSSTDSTATQAGYANRALGIRQTTSFGDPGAAFAFNCATTGVNITSISFSAQTLSVQTASTAWSLQYGVGAKPSAWTTLATFANPEVFGATTIAVNSATLGSALNNLGNVWLRVVALTGATGGGSRDTFAIDNFSITSGPVVSITTPPSPQTITSGQLASFTVGATGTGTLTYQWRKNGTALSGATGATLTLPSALTTDAGSYDVIVTDTVGSATSSAATLTVNPIATTIAFSSLTATYDGNPHAATATPTPSGATVTLTYTGIGATPFATSSTAPVNAGYYLVTATVTDSEHQGTASNTLVISSAAGAVAPIVTTAPATQAVFFGDTVTFTVAATGTPAPTFQWRKNGVAIPGATNTSFTLPSAALTDAGTYDVVVTNAGGSFASAPATLTVSQRSQTITFTAPTATYPAGTAVPLTATASSGLPVSYTIVSGAGAISGSMLTGFSATVVVGASQPGNATGYAAATQVNQTFAFVSGGLAPFLFTTPLDQTVNAGAAVTFSAAATGTPAPAWQWQKDGAAVAGATTATLTLASAALADAGRYTVTATNNAGSASASAALTVRAAPVVVAPPASQTVFAGASVTFSATITGFPAPAFQWRKNGTAIAGATAAALTLPAVSAADAARYDVVATNPLGSATSAAAALVVTTRDFSGEYFGSFGSSSSGVAVAGNFALYVRPDNTAVFLGYVPGTGTGLATTSLVVDLTGNFSLSFAPVAANATAPSTTPAAGLPSVTLRGSLNDATGAVVATVPELALTLTGTRAARTGAVSALAGFYSGAFVDSAAGRGYVIVGADGQAYVFGTSGSSAGTGAIADGAAGTIASNGRLLITTAAQSTFNLSLGNGALSGTVNIVVGTNGGSPIVTIATLDGAIDGLVGTERLANLSVRGVTGPGVATLITGFVVTGTASKQVLIRAAGPALAGPPFNLAGTLDNPELLLFRGNAVIAQNDDWGTPAGTGASSAATIAAAAAGAGAFAFRNGSTDAALLTTLAPGAYTVQVEASPATTGAGATATTGVVLAEIYELPAAGETPGSRRLTNLSARGAVTPGAPLTAGIVINGTAPQRVLIRGIGPTLGLLGVPGTLANPTLTLFQGGAVVKTNDDWFRDPDAALIAAAAAKAGAFTLGSNSLDAAMLLYLAPGGYTAQVSASGGTNGTGLALIEVYDAAP